MNFDDVRAHCRGAGRKTIYGSVAGPIEGETDMGFELLQREAPEIATAICADVIVAVIEPRTFPEVVARVDVSKLPERPYASRWSGNPFAPSVIVMDALARLTQAGVINERMTANGSVYRLATRIS